jgi:hypothetical protein
MDEPEVFDGKTKIIEGLYYIETDSYFPLRGNGWYYHSLVQYCLDNKIITKNNIKYERAAIASGGGMRRSEEAKVSEEAVRRKGGEGGPRKLGMGYGEAEEPV